VKITFVTVNLEVSPRTKRTLLRVGLPAVLLLAAGGIAYASLPHTFATGEVLTAANLNADFQSLDTRVTALEGNDSVTSGSRIVARFTTTSSTDGEGAQRTTKTFAGWLDTQRNEPCTVTMASDGQQRCLPDALNYLDRYGVFYFSDAACTQPVVRMELGTQCPPATYGYGCAVCNAPVPSYASFVYPCGGTGTTPGTHLVPLGAQIQGTVYLRFIGDPPGTCTQSDTGSGATNQFAYYDATGAEIPASSFAAFTVTTQTQ
jgi:hypothetical protein